MPTIYVDHDPPIEPPPSFDGDTAPLVYFLSFAFTARFGDLHELAKAAQLLRGGDHQIDLRPILTFADRDTEEPADEEELKRVWQDAEPLARCCRSIVKAIDADGAIREELREFPTLRHLIDALGRIARRGAEQGARVRLTYTMG